MGNKNELANPSLIWISFYDVELDPIMVADVVGGFANK